MLANDAYKAALKELDKRIVEINALRTENDILKQQLNQSPVKPDPIHLPLPKQFIFNEERWGVQYKQVRNYKYIYLYKRINKKLHQINIGKVWDENTARMKLIKYKTEKKLIFNR